MARMIETAVAAFGGLDVLHNNASDASTNALDMDIATLDMACSTGSLRSTSRAS